MTPAYVFIDASSYERQRFHFHSEPLASITQLAQQGHMRFLLPEIAYEEVRSRICINCREAATALNAARKAVVIADGIDLEPFRSLRDRDKWRGALETELLRRYDAFIKGMKPELISPKRSVMRKVFGRYFREEPPFDVGEKKHEFPDAFVIETLRQWQQERGERVIVVSADTDFKRALAGSPQFIVYENFEPVLKELHVTKNGRSRAAAMLARCSKKEFVRVIRKAFPKQLFFLDGSHHELPREHIKVQRARIDSISKVEVDGKRVTVRLEAALAFKAVERITQEFRPAIDEDEEVEASSVHSRYHETERPIELRVKFPATIRFEASDNLLRLERILTVEINDGLPLDYHRVLE